MSALQLDSLVSVQRCDSYLDSSETCPYCGAEMFRATATHVGGSGNRLWVCEGHGRELGDSGCGPVLDRERILGLRLAATDEFRRKTARAHDEWAMSVAQLPEGAR